MKTFAPALSFFLLLVLMFSHCNKNKNNPPPPEPVYRLVFEEFSTLSGDKTIREFSFGGNKLSHEEYREAGERIVTDYAYGEQKVIGDSQNFTDTTLTGLGRTEYLFENELLTEINTLKKTENGWQNTGNTEFTYDGGKIVQYIETRRSTPYAKGIYQYADNKLVKFTGYRFDGDWTQWIEDEFVYKGDTLKESYWTIDLVGVLRMKMVYSYESGLLNQIFSYAFISGEWKPAYLTGYTYDEYKNPVKEEVRYANDSSLFHSTNYRFEEGESNLETLIYTGLPDTPALSYPKPAGVFPNRHLLQIMIEKNTLP